MYEGLHSALGGIGCVSYVEYFASTNGMMSAMCWTCWNVHDGHH